MHHITRRLAAAAAALAALTLALGLGTSSASAAPATHFWLKLSFVHSGQVINSAGGTTNVGAPIIQWPFVQSQHNSQWEMALRGSSGYEIVNRLSRQCLDVPSKEAGAQLQQRPCDGTVSQRFVFDTTPPNSTYSVLKNVWSQLVIDQAEATQEMGGPVIQWPRTNGTNQRIVVSHVATTNS